MEKETDLSGTGARDVLIRLWLNFIDGHYDYTYLHALSTLRSKNLFSIFFDTYGVNK